MQHCSYTPRSNINRSDTCRFFLLSSKNGPRGEVISSKHGPHGNVTPTVHDFENYSALCRSGPILFSIFFLLLEFPGKAEVKRQL